MIAEVLLTSKPQFEDYNPCIYAGVACRAPISDVEVENILQMFMLCLIKDINSNLCEGAKVIDTRF